MTEGEAHVADSFNYDKWKGLERKCGKETAEENEKASMERLEDMNPGGPGGMMGMQAPPDAIRYEPPPPEDTYPEPHNVVKIFYNKDYVMPDHLQQLQAHGYNERGERIKWVTTYDYTKTRRLNLPGSATWYRENIWEDMLRDKHVQRLVLECGVGYKRPTTQDVVLCKYRTMLPDGTVVKELSTDVALEFEAIKEAEEWLVIHNEKKAERHKIKTARREAEMNAQARLDKAWEVVWDGTYKRFYFWNAATQASSWTPPTPKMADEEEAAWAKYDEEHGTNFFEIRVKKRKQKEAEERKRKAKEAKKKNKRGTVDDEDDTIAAGFLHMHGSSNDKAKQKADKLLDKRKKKKKAKKEAAEKKAKEEDEAHKKATTLVFGNGLSFRFPSPVASRHKVGDKVEAMYQEKGAWYKGVVTECLQRFEYSIAYDDGSEETWVKEINVRPQFEKKRQMSAWMDRLKAHERWARMRKAEFDIPRRNEYLKEWSNRSHMGLPQGISFPPGLHVAFPRMKPQEKCLLYLAPNEGYGDFGLVKPSAPKETPDGEEGKQGAKQDDEKLEYLVPPNTPLLVEVELRSFINVEHCQYKNQHDNWVSREFKGDLIKRIVVRGVGKETANSRGTAYIHYQIRIPKRFVSNYKADFTTEKCFWSEAGSLSAAQPCDSPVIYDSRLDPKLSGQPVSFMLDEKEVEPAGLECAVKTMAKQEKALINMLPIHGFGEEGCPELGIPPNAQLEYFVELVDFKRNVEPWDTTGEEKIEYAEIARQNGNRSFREGKFKKAASRYEKALQYVTEPLLYDVLKPHKKVEARMKRLPCQLNLSACYLNLGRWQDARKQAQEVLDLEKELDDTARKMAEQEGKFRMKLEQPTKVKALYRRAKALEELGLFEDCEADYRAICELEPDNEQAAKNLQEFQQSMTLYEKQSTKMAKNIFQDIFTEPVNEKNYNVFTPVPIPKAKAQEALRKKRAPHLDR